MVALHREEVQSICAQLCEAERPIRVLRSIAWHASVKRDFFRHNAQHLPTVSYPKFDPKPTYEKLGKIRKALTAGSRVSTWMLSIADSLEHAATMLSCLGQPEFHHWSERIYGGPTTKSHGRNSNALALAQHLQLVVENVSKFGLSDTDSDSLSAQEVAAIIEENANAFFGGSAPKIVLSDDIASNAIAGPRRILIRRSARFTPRDVDELVNHEAYIHVATALNGAEQKALPILACSHPGTIRTQEGLAIFAELISGTIDLSRLKRLALRTIAIQQAIDGADFIDIYRFFLAETDNIDQSFENARRVFRGGVITGGAPFTKDTVYLDGLLSIRNFLNCIAKAGRTDCLRLLFCGKIDLNDIPALCELSNQGLCKSPKYLPPWANDVSFLFSYLAYNSFLQDVDSNSSDAHFNQFLSSAPVVNTSEV